MTNRIILERIETLEKQGQLRRLRVVNGPGPRAEVDGKTAIVFCSNDYLGILDHPDVKKRIRETVEAMGAGSGASRLISGTHPLHVEAERRLAGFIRTEASRLFSTGYQANVGALEALAEPGDVFFADELNHASLIDGARLSRATSVIYRHADLDDLEKQLRSTPAKGLRMIITDALFSMDGDLCPLSGIADLAQRYQALIYLDEAHSLGVFGPEGRGLAVGLGVEDRVDIRLGTLGKSFGLMGAFLGSSGRIIDLVTSRARSLLYTTAPPPFMAAAVLSALDIVQGADDRRERLFMRVDRFRKAAAREGIPLSAHETPIQPVILGSEDNALRVSAALLDRGYFVQAIRPPTVAPGTSRLRITLSARHTEDDVDGLVRNLASVM